MDFASILNNLKGQLGPITALETAISYILGIFLIFKAIYKLKEYGELRTMMSSNISLKQPLMYLVGGAVLIFIPTTIHVMNTTFFGVTDPNDILGRVPDTGASNWSAFEGIVLEIVRAVGLYAFIKGWSILAHNSEQGSPQNSAAKGLTHIVGGILAMNIYATIAVIGYTLGINVFY